MKVCKGSLQEVLVQRSCQIPSIRSFFDDCMKFSLRSWLEVLEFLFTDIFLNAVRAFLPSYDFKGFTLRRFGVGQRTCAIWPTSTTHHVSHGEQDI